MNWARSSYHGDGIPPRGNDARFPERPPTDDIAARLRVLQAVRDFGPGTATPPGVTTREATRARLTLGVAAITRRGFHLASTHRLAHALRRYEHLQATARDERVRSYATGCIAAIEAALVQRTPVAVVAGAGKAVAA